MALPQVASFRGEAPRVSPRKLPEVMAQRALNSRLLSGDLEAWKNFDFVESLCKGANVNTIYPLRDPAGVAYWLHWTDAELGDGAVEVDVAKSTTGDNAAQRVFLTGLDVPRWTNLALATTGSGCFPIETRPLGVVNPDAAPDVSVGLVVSPPINVSDDGANLTELWTTTPNFTTVGVDSLVTQEAAQGDPAPCYRTQYYNNVLRVASLYRDAGVGASNTIVLEADFRLTQGSSLGIRAAQFRIMGNASGAAITATYTYLPTPVLAIGYADSWSAGAGTILSTETCPTLDGTTWYRGQVTIVRQANGTVTATFEVLDGATVLATITTTNLTPFGGYVGFSGLTSINSGGQALVTDYDNIVIQASGVNNDPSDDVSTSYVYTFVNDQGEESGPSDPSETVLRDDGTQVTITMPTTQPTGLDYYVTAKRLYRAATINGVTAFYFVAEVSLATATYVDTLTDAQLGEALETTLYALPPTDLRGILALPNGIYAGFRQDSNQLCLTPINRPHAWPVEYRLSTDEPIVAIGNVDNNVIIATEAFAYLASGNSPEAFSMVKLELPQGCVSKRGCAYLKGAGWMYPSPDGLVAVAGTGQMLLWTEALYTRKEWQALNPSSLIASQHDDRYFGFYEADGVRQGVLIDPRQGGFGQVTLACHAIAAHDDPRSDTLYLVLDENDPPVLPSGPTGQWVVTGTAIYAWDSYSGSGPVTPLLPQAWTSRQTLMKGDLPLWAVVRADDYTDVWLVVSKDGATYDVKQVTSEDPFRLDAKLGTVQDYFQFTVYGTSTVNAALFAYDPEDFPDGN